MPEQSNNPLNFWQELKRRKVFRVIVMYAGVAYIIIELVNNVTEPLHLPEWTATLVILLLAIGFPIVAILSWIFDFTPEGLKKTEPAKAPKETTPKTGKRKLRISDGIIAVLVVVVCILLYPKIFKRDKLEIFRSQGEISLAVMPFRNMTGDDEKNFWQEIVQDNLITSLSNAEALKVRQTESVNTLLEHTDLSSYASITPSVASSISQKLEASVFIHGSINQVGENIRINAKLVDAETEEIFQSFQIDGTAENILNLADSLSGFVKDYLIVSILKKELPPDLQPFFSSTKSPEALRYTLDGTKAFTERNYAAARELYQRALEIDSNHTMACLHLAYAYGNQGYYDEAKKWTRKAYEKRENMSRMEKLFLNGTYATYFGTPHETIRYFREILEMDDQQAGVYYNLAINYNEIHQYEKAIPALEKALEIYDKWDIKPLWVYSYTALGSAYHNTGRYRKEKKLYRRAEKDFPDDSWLLNRQAILALSQGKTKEANEYMDKYISIRKESSASDVAIASSLGSIYTDAQIFEKAEEYYRKALSLEPERHLRLNNLGWFLIDNDRNLDEGIELVNRALELQPDQYNYLDSKGWGLYKQGKYREALEVLEKSWELKPVYSHSIFLHLEAARKAVAGEVGETM